MSPGVPSISEDAWNDPKAKMADMVPEMTKSVAAHKGELSSKTRPSKGVCT